MDLPKIIMKKILPVWHKYDSQRIRRLNVLISHKFDYLAAARSVRYLANITSDLETKRKAWADADYFFAKYHLIRKRNVKKS